MTTEAHARASDTGGGPSAGSPWPGWDAGPLRLCLSQRGQGRGVCFSGHCRLSYRGGGPLAPSEVLALKRQQGQRAWHTEACAPSLLCSCPRTFHNCFSFPEVCPLPPIAMCPGTSPRMACLGLSRTDCLLMDRLCAIRRVLHEHLARAPPAFSPSAPSLPRSLSPPVALSSCVVSPGPAQDSGRVPSKAAPPQRPPQPPPQPLPH